MQWFSSFSHRLINSIPVMDIPLILKNIILYLRQHYSMHHTIFNIAVCDLMFIWLLFIVNQKTTSRLPCGSNIFRLCMWMFIALIVYYLLCAHFPIMLIRIIYTHKSCPMEYILLCVSFYYSHILLWVLQFIPHISVIYMSRTLFLDNFSNPF